MHHQEWVISDTMEDGYIVGDKDDKNSLPPHSLGMAAV